MRFCKQSMAKLSEKHIILPLPYLKNRKSALILVKSSWLCPSLGWIFHSKCVFNSIFEKELQNFSQQGLSLVCFWRNDYRSALVPRNLPYLEIFLVARLHEEIALNSMSQTKEKCNSFVLSRSYLWMVWRCHGIPCVYRYCFCLEPTVRKDTWMRTISVTVMVILFEISILKVTWLQLCSKFLLKNYKPHWKQCFKRYPTFE